MGEKQSSSSIASVLFGSKESASQFFSSTIFAPNAKVSGGEHLNSLVIEKKDGSISIIGEKEAKDANSQAQNAANSKAAATKEGVGEDGSKPNWWQGSLYY